MEELDEVFQKRIYVSGLILVENLFVDNENPRYRLFRVYDLNMLGKHQHDPIKLLRAVSRFPRNIFAWNNFLRDFVEPAEVLFGGFGS